MEVHQKILRVPSTLATVGNSQFNKYLVYYLLLEPNSPQTLRLYEDNERTPSTYSQKARLGYKYWLDDPYPYNGNPGKFGLWTTLHYNNRLMLSCFEFSHIFMWCFNSDSGRFKGTANTLGRDEVKTITLSVNAQELQ